MKRQVARMGVAVFAALHLLVIAGPAVVLALAADKGGLPQWHGLDLVVVSLVIGVAHALLVEHRLDIELREVDVSRDAFIAAFNALVVLAMINTGLIMAVLGAFAPEHAAFVNNGWPVLLLWTLILLGAVMAAETTRSLILRWLEPHHEGHFH